MSTPEVTSRLLRLMRILDSRTRAGSATWSRTANGRYETSFDRTSYAIVSIDGDGQAPFALEGYDSTGLAVLNIDTRSIDNQTANEVGKLYQAISGIVDNEDLLKFLDEAIKDIDDEEPPF